MLQPSYMHRSPFSAYCLPCHYTRALALKRAIAGGRRSVLEGDDEGEQGGQDEPSATMTGCPCTRHMVCVFYYLVLRVNLGDSTSRAVFRV